MYFYYCIWLVSDYYSVPQWNGLDCCNWIVVNRKNITYLHSAFNWAFCLHLNKFSLVSNISNRFKCKVMLVLVDFTNTHLSFIELSSNLNKKLWWALVQPISVWENGSPCFNFAKNQCVKCNYKSQDNMPRARKLLRINVFSDNIWLTSYY